MLFGDSEVKTLQDKHGHIKMMHSQLSGVWLTDKILLQHYKLFREMLSKCIKKHAETGLSLAAAEYNMTTIQVLALT